MPKYQGNIIYGSSDNNTGGSNGIYADGNRAVISNNIIRGIANTSSGTAKAIVMTGDFITVIGNEIYDITSTSSFVYGIQTASTASHVNINGNNIAFSSIFLGIPISCILNLA